ncbi:hypothetical protein C810_01390 [Lachnospiraceae bacterium A2]|nr:hypothetical protein C810_01390 [Lachnospiraceae bacterium A2]
MCQLKRSLLLFEGRLRFSFMASQELLKEISNAEKYIERHGVDIDAVNAFHTYVFWADEEDKDIETALKISPRAKELMNQYVINGAGGDIWELEKFCFANKTGHEMVDKWYEILKLEAPYKFESYLLYLEKKREISERFYSPKRKQLNKHGLIQAMQDLEDDKYDRICISMPPGTQKTTLEKFFCSWIIGKYPKDYSLFFSHNSDITEKYYKGVLDITTDNLEYTWSEIFPDVKLQSTNAKLQEINFGKYKPYSSIQCSSIGSKNAGKVRTNRYLYCDDLIGTIEEALNPTILDKIWRIYGVDLKQRKLNQQVKEVIIMTRWSTKDVVGRIIELYGSSDRTKIISVEDIDPITGKSNFDYEYNGMTVEFFNDQALTMDDISYRCLYKQQPIEREGLLFPEGKVMRYDDEEIKKLREKPPELITGQCDTKGKGTDFFVLPCFEKYGDYYYCTDCVCDNSPDYELQYENSANLIVDNEMQDCVFESNNGGDRVAEEVQKRVEEKGWICNITSVPTESNKEARIYQCSNWILQHVKFKDKSMYAPKSQYGVMMAQLLSYSVSGKNINDDVADVFATFALRIKKGNGRRKTIIMPSPI